MQEGDGILLSEKTVSFLGSRLGESGCRDVAKNLQLVKEVFRTVQMNQPGGVACLLAWPHDESEHVAARSSQDAWSRRKGPTLHTERFRIRTGDREKCLLTHVTASSAGWDAGPSSKTHDGEVKKFIPVCNSKNEAGRDKQD